MQEQQGVYRRGRLWFEFMSLFVVVPILMATAMPAGMIWPVLSTVTIVAVILLQITPGFHWRVLKRGRWIENTKLTLLLAIVTAVISCALILWLLPEKFLHIPRTMPGLWLLILILYPLVSALPQEIIFRVLFIERYGVLFPQPALLIAVNAVCFGLAHLFYGNWPALILSTLGGAVFAWAYLYKHSFAYALFLHSLAGQIVFTSGLGIFFYHGAVGTL